MGGFDVEVGLVVIAGTGHILACRGGVPTCPLTPGSPAPGTAAAHFEATLGFSPRAWASPREVGLLQPDGVRLVVLYAVELPEPTSPLPEGHSWQSISSMMEDPQSHGEILSAACKAMNIR